VINLTGYTLAHYYVQKRYYQRNKEKRVAQMKKWREKNKDKFKEQAAKRYKEKKVTIAASVEKNPDWWKWVRKNIVKSKTVKEFKNGNQP